jgi:glycosyltransferase involved in cell wall biosynthesis
MPNVYVIIPAFNEAGAIGKVVRAVPRGLVSEIIVCDNKSTDATAQCAREAGATVVYAPEPGYGSACLCGIAYLKSRGPSDQPDIVVFLDGDYSDYPEEMLQLTAPIIEGSADLVIGSRALGKALKGALQPQQRFGNWLATSLIRLIWGYHFTDLGPFRAISWTQLTALDMGDPNYGWTVEMQVKAASKRIRCIEVPVSYRPRIGKSKVSGTLRGSVLAGHKILWTIFRYAFGIKR